MATGPVNVLVVGFVDGDFHGQMATALADLIDRGLVRIQDLVFISKDAEGNVTAVELDALGDTADQYARLDGEIGGLLSEADLAHAGADLAPGTAAAVLVWENLWSRDFTAALSSAGGTVLGFHQIPADDVDAAFAALTAD